MRRIIMILAPFVGACSLMLGFVLVVIDICLNAGFVRAGLNLPAYAAKLHSWEAEINNNSELFGELSSQWKWTIDSTTTGNFSLCLDCTGEYDPTCVFVPSSRKPTSSRVLKANLPPPTTAFELALTNGSTVLLSESFSPTRTTVDLVTCEALQEICLVFDPDRMRFAGGCSGVASKPERFRKPGEDWPCRTVFEPLPLLIRLPDDPYVVAGEFTGGLWDWSYTDCNTFLALSITGPSLLLLAVCIWCFCSDRKKYDCVRKEPPKGQQ